MVEIPVRFRHLQCFLAIAEFRTVIAAADALGITQPALSKTLRELEEALEAKLFHRGRKGMILTAAGEKFIQYAAASIASIQQGIGTVRQLQRTSGVEIRVGVLPNVASNLAPCAVSFFKQHAKDSIVRVVTGDNALLLDRLRLGELAMVVGRLAQPESMLGLQFELLFDEPITLVVRRGHDLTKVKRFDLSMIAEYPCVFPQQGTIIRHEIDRFLFTQKIPTPGNLVETTSAEFAFRYVQDTDAVWFVPMGYMKSDAKNNLAELAIDKLVLRGPVGITTRMEMRLSVAEERMIQAFKVAASMVSNDQ